jgi:hemoglobin/transferrin/lactoferrin receptor protein
MKNTYRFLICLTMGIMAAELVSAQAPLQPPPYLTLIDPVYLNRIEGAEVQVFTDSDLWVQGQTNAQGRFVLADQWPDSGYVMIEHPAYEKQRLTLQELSGQQYEVYLDLRSYATKEVFFTAGRYLTRSQEVPHHVEVITAAETQFRNPQTAAELLAQDGSVFVQKSQMGGGSPNLRGFEANKVLLVIDGVRMNNAIYRSGHLQNVITLDPAIIDRSEVMFGPGAVIYGSDALGGVLHFSTKDPQLRSGTDPVVSGEIDARYGTVNRERSLHTHVNLAGKRWAALTSVSVSDFGDLRSGAWRPSYPDWGRRDSLVITQDGEDHVVANSSPDLQAPTAYQQLHVLQKVLFVPDARHSHLLNIQYTSSSDIPRYDRLVQTRNGRLRYAEWAYGPQTRLLASYRLRHSPANGWYDQLSIQPAYQYIEESRYDRLFQATERDEQRERLHIASLNVDARKQLSPRHRLSFGMEALVNQVSSSGNTLDLVSGARRVAQSRYPAGGSEYASLAAYLTHYWQWRPGLSWQAGLRLSGIAIESRLGEERLLPLPFDRISQRNVAPSGNLSLNWVPSTGWHLAWLAGTGFRAPNLDDLGKVFDSQPGNVIVPNPGLQPEYTYNTELNLRRHWGEWLQIGLNGYLTYYDQAIVVRDFADYGVDSLLYDGQWSSVQANVNAGAAWLTGGSFSVRSKLGPWRLSAQATYTYGLVTATQTLLDHIPPWFGLLRIGFEQGPWEVEATTHGQAWKRLDPNRTAPPYDDPRDLSNLEYATQDGWPAWWRLDLNAAYRGWTPVTVQVGVENLFDLHYRPYASRISAPGRNLYLALRGNF